MKKIKISSLLVSIFLLSGISFADINFSTIAGGSMGISGTASKSPTFDIPFNAFAATQINFDSWGIFRANIEIHTQDILDKKLFTGQNATIKMNELSFLTTKSGKNIRNYFALYLGTYEAVGCDEHIIRQFGIEPYSSLITKSATTLSCGFSLYDNYGVGLAYTMNFANAPGTFGINSYFNKKGEEILNFNFDLRTAWTTRLITFDFATGIEFPLQNKYGGNDVVLLIDTLYAHGGLSVLIGSHYTHALLLQAGIQNVEIKKGSFGRNFDGTNDLSLLAEIRIYSKNIKSRLTAYNIPTTDINDMVYLYDPIGAVFTIFSDTIPVKNNNMTIGCHLIGSLPNQNLFTISNAFDSKIPTINVFAAPFVTIPISNGSIEIMSEFGVLNILESISFNYQAKIGYKRTF